MKGFLNEERLVGIIRRSDSLLRFLFSDASPHRSCVDDFGGTAIGLDLFLDVCVELQCAPQELLEYLTQRGVSVTDASDSAWTSFESPLTRDQLLYLSQDFDGQPPWRPTASRATLLCKDLLGVGVAPDWVEAEAVFGELFGADTGKWIRNFDGATAQNFDQYHTARFPTHEHKDAKHWSTGLGRGLSPRPQVLWSDGLTDRRTAEFAAASSAVCLSSERDIPLSAAIAALVAAGAPDCSMVFDRRALGRQVGAGWAGTLASVIGTAVDGQGSIGAEVALGAIEARSSDAAVVSELATWLSQDVAEPLFGEIDVSDRRRERGELCLLSTDLDPLGAIPRRLTAFAQFRVAARLGVALDVAHTHLASIAPVGVELADVSDLGDLRPSWDCVRHFANRWGDAANAGVPDDDWFRQATATWLAVRPTTEDPST